MSQPNSALMEFPAGMTEEVTALDMLIKARREDLRSLNGHYEQTKASIQSEISKHESLMAAERQKSSLLIKERLAEVDQLKAEVNLELRRLQDSEYRQAQAEQVAQDAAATALKHKQALADLNAERMEVALLRRQAEELQQQASVSIANAQHTVNQANAEADKAKKIMDASEARNKALDERWNELNIWQKNIELQVKNYEALKQHVDEQMSALKEAQTSASIGALESKGPITVAKAKETPAKEPEPAPAKAELKRDPDIIPTKTAEVKATAPASKEKS